MNVKEVVLALLFVFFGIVVVSLFWENTVVVCFLLVVLAFVKHLVIPIKKELLWFVIVAVLGSVTESMIIFLGGSPWAYVRPEIFNIPFWLLFLWGFAGTVFISLYQAVFSDK